MIYIEVSPKLRLRPSHLLLMIYRYLSGVYQVGDLFALNYIKGFLDGNSASKPKRILTVSGHGIGEAETWLAERIEDCHIDTVSFRLIDTQLLHFLRAAEPGDIETVFLKFAEMVGPYELLSKLASNPGLIPYWCNQTQHIKHCFQHRKITVFSNHPLRIDSRSRYDLIYVSQGTQYCSIEAAEKLRQRLVCKGWLAILTPPSNGHFNDNEFVRFARAKAVLEAKALFRSLLQAKGYVLASLPEPTLDLNNLAIRSEISRFNVLATANSLLLGELILASVGEHISDRARLQILNDTAAQFKELNIPVNEELELHMMEAKS